MSGTTELRLGSQIRSNDGSSDQTTQAIRRQQVRNSLKTRRAVRRSKPDTARHPHRPSAERCHQTTAVELLV